MVHKVVALARTPVTLSNNRFSAQQFVQDLARGSSQKNAFFVADLGKIHLLVSEWTAKLSRVQPFYAMNANSDELLLKVLASSGLGLHCSNRQQQEVALDFVGPDRLFYSNPNWTRATIAGAHTNNVGLLGFDSEADLSRMAKGKISNKLILNVRMDEEESVVGCNISNAPELLQLAADFGLDCVGVGFNMCVQRLGIFDSIIECAAQLFAIGRSMGLNMRVLNLGGGFSSPFSQHTPSFDQLCEQINISLDYYFPLEQNQNIAIIATPGRYFASSVFSLATRIVDKFETDASQITNDDFDAGQRGFVYKISEGYYGPFGCRVVPNCLPECLPLFADLEDDQTAELFYGSIHGPAINDEFDVVQKQCFLRQLNEGDWLLWQNMGAYTMGNVDSLDDEPCAAPQVYYFSKDSDWKYADDSSDFSDVFTTLEDEPCCDDGESEISEDSAIEMDCFWTAEWPII